jgi:protein-S-isoprenylcysteine O-methyltransferase Ste14
MVTTFLAYLLIVGFIVTEGRTRKGEAAQSLEAGAFDQQSTRRLGLAYMVVILGLLSAPFLNYFGIGVLPWSGVIGWAGLIVAALGVGVRLWANHILGEFYTRTLKVTEKQVIVEEGPYKLIRHPGYMGMILLWVGAGLAVGNWLALLLAAGVMFAAYAYRIRSEETMMAASYGEQYQSYQRQTRKLIPFIY